MVQPAHTAHACRFCRQKRSKCNGETPCDRCQRWNQPCVYDERTKETKGELRKERDELLNRDRDANAIFKALQSGDLAHETIASLWSRTPLEQIASKLGGPSSSGSARRPSASGSSSGAVPDGAPARHSDDMRDPLARLAIASPTSSNNSTSPPLSAIDDAPKRPRRDTSDILSHFVAPRTPSETSQITDPSRGPWGLVGLDTQQVMKLLDVFFDWQYMPLFHVNRKALETDFLELRHENCSPALIRSMLCLACRSLEGYDNVSSFHVNLGGRLLQETETLLNDPENKTRSLPDAQAFGFLALHELGLLKKSEALTHAEACVRMLLDLHEEKTHAELDVSKVSWSSPLSTCLQGSIALARIIHLFFRLLQPPAAPNSDTPKAKATNWLSPEINDSNKGVHKVLQTPTTVEPSSDEERFSAILVTLTSSVYCFLSTLTIPVTEYPNELLRVYHGCLSQYTGLIAALQTSEVSRTSILFTHLVHHFSLLSLCRPFSHIPAGPDATIDFRAICLEAAQAILSLSSSYVDIVSSRQLPVFVPLFAYAAGLVSHELATGSYPGFRPPSMLHQSSTDSSSKETDRTGSQSSTLEVPSPATSISPGGLSAISSHGSDPGGKRKIHQITVSPLKPPVSTQAGSELSKAVECLSNMGRVFPMAREAEEHLKQLMPGSAEGSAGGDFGYGFPLPRR